MDRKKPRLLSKSTICQYLGGISMSTLQRIVLSDPEFPDPIYIRPRSLPMWDVYLVDLWIEARGGLPLREIP